MSESANSSSFDLNAFIRESKDVLVNPKLFFSTMKTSGGLVEPLIKAVIYGVAAGVITFLWSILGIGAVGMFGGAIGAMTLVWSIIAAIIGLFIGAIIVLIISAICNGNTDFESCARVVAATMVVMPISALLGFTVGINSTLGMIISLGVNLFALYLLYHGLIQALKAKPETTRIVMYVLAALLVLFMIVGMGTRKRMNKFMNEFKNEDIKEMMKDNENN
jgi:hypothetical protein